MAQIRLSLSANHCGQILDGLSVLIEQWDATAEFLENGQSRDNVIIREASDSHEAISIAGLYRQIRDEIERQLPKT